MITLSSFATDSSTLSNTLKIKIAHLATKIVDNLDDVVTLTGYSSDSLGKSVALALARTRVQKVELFLRSRLTQLDDPRVTIIARTAISQGATLTAQLKSRSVVALVR
ncbi:MAG: hypothetical protein WBD82_01460 [Acidimicrobiales bacterium]